jgi:hypothetical protein
MRFRIQDDRSWRGRGNGEPTLGDLLALVDLVDLLIKELVTLLADLDNLLTLNAEG